MSTETPLPTPDFSKMPDHQRADIAADYKKVEDILGKYSPEYRVYYPGSEPPMPERDPWGYERFGQSVFEVVYDRMGNIITKPVGAEHTPDDREIAWRLQIDHVVKKAPKLADQVGDMSRQNTIYYLASTKSATTKAHEHLDDERAIEITEAEALTQLEQFLIQAENDPRARPITRQQIKSIRESITFIGDKELQEAAKGLATYWKDRLDKSPRKQLIVLPIDQTLAPSQGYNGDGIIRKSSTFMLDTILGYFTDEERAKYAPRLIFSLDGLGRTALKSAHVILLDDWVLSGRQLHFARSRLKEQFPGIGVDGIEINLVAASQELIHTGLSGETNGFTQGDWSTRHRTPIRAYFETRNADGFFMANEGRGSFATGFYSASDYVFEDPIAWIVSDHRDDNQPTILSCMPPLTNIARPYRYDSYEPQRLRRWIKLQEDLNK